LRLSIGKISKMVAFEMVNDIVDDLIEVNDVLFELA
jgi:hypothetical protein